MSSSLDDLKNWQDKYCEAFGDDRLADLTLCQDEYREILGNLFGNEIAGGTLDSAVADAAIKKIKKCLESGKPYEYKDYTDEKDAGQQDQ
ncbi:MAG: hypothetical protein FWE94_04325 [Coriobacteriia bacterium]|nr:hypothetical protein [Coriobacteriia bacterium]